MDNETQESISLPENNVDKVNPVEYSNHLKLNPKLFPLSNPELHVLYQAGTDKTPSILGFYITEQKDRKTTYVGHTVFNINKPFPDTAALSINYGKTASFNRGLEDSKGISDDIKSLAQNGSIFNALEISDGYRDKKIGGLFWTASMKLLHERGIKKVQIEGDVTIGKIESLSSFYVNQGAEVDEKGKMEIDLEQYVIRNQDLIAVIQKGSES